MNRIVAELSLFVDQLNSDPTGVDLVPLRVPGIVLLLHLNLQATEVEERETALQKFMKYMYM